MKNSVKKITAIALSSLGILASAPSAFCTKKNLAKKTNPTNHCMPEYSTENSKPIVNVPDRFFELQESGDLVPGRYSNFLIDEFLAAPHASGTVRKNAFHNQTRLISIFLPLIQRIEGYAFNGCKNLKILILSKNLKSIDPKAFAGCNPSLVIYIDNAIYTISELLAHFDKNSSSANK